MTHLIAQTIAALVLVLTLSGSIAQEAKQPADSYGIFGSQQEYYDFMGSVKREGVDNPELMAMVPMINDIVLLQPFGSSSKKYGTADSTLGILSDADVRKELEMVDSQYQDLQLVNQEIQKRFAARIRALDLTDMRSAVEQILSLRHESEKELQATLLPHQMKRLRQLAARNQLRRKTLAEVITSEPLKSDLQISDAQAETLLEAEREIEIELELQIAELRAKARKQFLSKLKSDQRSQLEQIFGPDLALPVRHRDKRNAKLRK